MTPKQLPRNKFCKMGLSLVLLSDARVSDAAGACPWVPVGGTIDAGGSWEATQSWGCRTWGCEFGGERGQLGPCYRVAEQPNGCSLASSSLGRRKGKRRKDSWVEIETGLVR